MIQDKCLLAFSGGIDSTALFFKLLDTNTIFDIAIVDYGLREQSKDEVAYAKELCNKYNKKCFVREFSSDIRFNENVARTFRYNFFEDIIKNENYTTLLTAHQLNDKLEWFLMQLGKGAGISELIGLQESEKRNNYILKRPLLGFAKKELKQYLDTNNITYFIDQSNFDTKYKRNHIRQKYSDNFVEEYLDGIKRSFKYLQQDNISLFDNITVNTQQELTIFDYNGNNNIAIRLIDKELKKRGILISSATREEILNQQEIVVSDKLAISITKNKIFIAPKCNITMKKDFKEKCRLNHIPKNIRGYLYTIKHFYKVDELVN
ncbi:tRNA(Ile)-lysidine synthetase [hydrothermal vent metagenome]|uniref:tRNA(Ile)-lysidine synthetase n=1 Tax=hydrothermal vent metagenome TaxID=652676 RepID=A0A3B1E9K5_9ZZZZ